MTDFRRVLSKSCSINSSIFYKQRLFQKYMPTLLQMYDSISSAERAAAFHTAIGSISSNIPEKALLGFASSLSPFFVKYMENVAAVADSAQETVNVDVLNALSLSLVPTSFCKTSGSLFQPW